MDEGTSQDQRRAALLCPDIQSFIGESMPGFRKMIPVKDTLSSRTKDYHQETNSFIHGDAYLLRQSYSKFRRIRRGSTDS